MKRSSIMQPPQQLTITERQSQSFGLPEMRFASLVLPDRAVPEYLHERFQSA
jgi:hypothetical protein